MTTTQTIIDNINVSELGVVFYRQITRILDEQNKPNDSYYRSSIAPGSDISNLPIEVQNACNAAWTPEVIANFDAYLKSITSVA